MPNTKRFELPYGTTGLTTIVVVLRRRSDNYICDNIDGVFRAAPTQKSIPALEDAAVPGGVYYIAESRQVFQNDTYVAFFYNTNGSAVEADWSLLGKDEKDIINDAVPLVAGAGDFTTLAKVKAWLKINSADPDRDAVLSRLITACSTFMETYMSRHIASAAYDEKYNGRGGTALGLRNFNVNSITALTIDGINIVPAPDTLSNGYVFDDTHVYLRGYEFTKGRQNVRVQYTAGEAAIPADLEQGCIETVCMRYKEIDRIGHQSKTIAGETISFDLSDFPKDVKTMMNQYRRTVPII